MATQEDKDKAPVVLKGFKKVKLEKKAKHDREDHGTDTQENSVDVL